MRLERTALLLVVLLAAFGLVGPARSQESMLRLRVEDRFGRSLVSHARICDAGTDPCTPIEAGESGDRLLVPRPERSTKIRVACPGFEARDVDVDPASPATLDAVLKAAGSAVLVLDGENTNGVSVDVAARLAESGGEGAKPFFSERAALGRGGARVTIPDLPPGAYDVSWEGPEVLSGRVELASDGSGGVTTKVLKIIRGAMLRGSVHDDVGAPVQGARVALVTGVRAEALSRAVSSKDGTFELRSVPIGEPVRYRAVADGYFVKQGVWGGESRLEIVLDRSACVSFRVLSSQGQPLSGARIASVYPGIEGPIPIASIAGSDGRGRVCREQLGPMKLVLSAPGHAVRALDVSVSEDGDLGDLSLEAGRSLSGRVASRNGLAGVAGARVSVDGEPVGGVVLSLPFEATTDGDGRFLLDGLPERDATIRVRAAGYAQAQRRIPAGTESVEILLGAEGRLEVVVCGTPEEIAASVVSCRPQLPGVRAETRRVDAAGRAVFESLEAGPMACSRLWRFPRASGDFLAGSYASPKDVTVPEGGTGTLRLGCDGPVLSGVLIAGGRPLASANGGARHQGTKETVSFATDASGRFSFRVPAPGVYDVQIFYVGGQPVALGSFGGALCEVGAGGRVGVELELKK